MERILGDLEERRQEEVPKTPRISVTENSDIQKESERHSPAVGPDVSLWDHAEPPPASGPSHGPGESFGTGGHWTAEPPETPYRPLPSRHGNGALWCAVVVLALALLAGLGYTYLMLHEDHISITEVPGKLHALASLGGRMASAEENFRGLVNNWNALSERVSNLDRKVDTRLRVVGRETHRLIAESEGRMRAEIDQRGQAMEVRLGQIESNQKQDQARLAELHDQLQMEVANLRSEMASNQDAARNGMASLQQHVTQNEEAVTDLHQKLQRRRVNFEVVKNSPSELAPGLSLTVLKTDPAFQRFRGYVSLTNEGRTMWLQNLGAEESLDVFPHDSNHPYSLVITAVNPKGVVGYLLLPAGV